jgi:hypothetical protein
MKELIYLFELFYSKFLLRDFCGKIIPGFIVIFVGIFILFLPKSSIREVLNFSFWGWVLFIGVAWITGFVVQSFGHVIHLINYVHRGKKGKIPKNISKIKRIFINVFRFFQCSSEDERQQRERKFNNELQFFQYATTDEKQQRERTVVIKEAAGNGFVALLICLLFLLFSLIFNYQEFPNVNWILNYGWQKGLIFIFIIISVGSLYWLYRQSEINQFDYQDQVIKRYKPPSRSE